MFAAGSRDDNDRDDDGDSDDDDACTYQKLA